MVAKELMQENPPDINLYIYKTLQNPQTVIYIQNVYRNKKNNAYNQSKGTLKAVFITFCHFVIVVDSYNPLLSRICL